MQCTNEETTRQKGVQDCSVLQHCVRTRSVGAVCTVKPWTMARQKSVRRTTAPADLSKLWIKAAASPYQKHALEGEGNPEPDVLIVAVARLDHRNDLDIAPGRVHLHGRHAQVQLETRVSTRGPSSASRGRTHVQRELTNFLLSWQTQLLPPTVFAGRLTEI